MVQTAWEQDQQAVSWRHGVGGRWFGCFCIELKLPAGALAACPGVDVVGCRNRRSEEHTSELKSLMRSSYAVFCLTKKKHSMSNKYNIHISQIWNVIDIK